MHYLTISAIIYTDYITIVELDEIITNEVIIKRREYAPYIIEPGVNTASISDLLWEQFERGFSYPEYIFPQIESWLFVDDLLTGSSAAKEGMKHLGAFCDAIISFEDNHPQLADVGDKARTKIGPWASIPTVFRVWGLKDVTKSSTRTGLFTDDSLANHWLDPGSLWKKERSTVEVQGKRISQERWTAPHLNPVPVMLERGKYMEPNPRWDVVLPAQENPFIKLQVLYYGMQSINMISYLQESMGIDELDFDRIKEAATLIYSLPRILLTKSMKALVNKDVSALSDRTITQDTLFALQAAENIFRFLHEEMGIRRIQTGRTGDASANIYASFVQKIGLLAGGVEKHLGIAEE